MSPYIALVLAELAKQTPVLVIDIIQLLSKETATDADWDNLRAKWSVSYEAKKAAAEARLDN